MKDSLQRQFLDLKKSNPLKLRFGGKGEGLIRLHQIGLNIPDTWGYSCDQWRLLQGTEWNTWLKSVAFLDRTFDLPVVFSTQLDLLDLSPFLNQPRAWIVRSSASAEDAADDSFAGVFQSVIVTSVTEVNLRAAIREVVASMLSPVAIERYLESGKEISDYAPAFLIQEWIEPEWAGVAFSADPEKPWLNKPYVELVRGRGELLVSGNTDAIVVNDLSQLARTVAPDFQYQFELDFKKMPIHFLGAIDTEFAFRKHKLYWLQARPLATREAQLMRYIENAPYEFAWSRDLTAERYPEPMSILGWSQIEDLLPENLRSLYHYFGISATGHELLLQSLHGWVFSNDHFFKVGKGLRFRSRWVMRNLPKLLLRFFKTATVSFFKRLRSGRFEGWQNVLKLQLLLAWMEPAAQQIQREWKPRIARYLAAEKRWNADIPSLHDPLAQQARLRADAVDFLEPDLAIYIFKETLFQAMRTWWLKIGGEEDHFVLLCSRFSGNRTLEMSREWEKVIQDSTLKPQWMERYGHIRMSWDPMEPGFSESTNYETGAQFGGRGRRTDENAIELIPAEKKLFSDPLFKKYFDLLQDFMRMDEEMHLETGRLIRRARALILKSGEVLVAKKVLKEVNDVFELELRELKRFLRKPTQAAWPACTKRRELRRRATVNPPHHLIPPTTTECALELTDQLGKNSFRGIGMSAGIVEGIVLFLEKPNAATPILPGTILLTTSPNPAWCPYYSTLAGLITVTGSKLSHGFVTAREYRLPAVSGIENLKTKIKNGSRVRLNGKTGEIEILEVGGTHE